MKKLLVTLLFTSLCLHEAVAAPVEPVDGKEKGWNLVTDNSVCQLRLDGKGRIYPVFWGARAAAAALAEQDRNRANGPFRVDEVPVRGRHADKTPVLEVVYADHTRDCELELVSAGPVEIDGRQTLRIVQKDKFYPLQVTSYLRVLPEYDMIEKWIEVQNTARGKGDVIEIENLLSGSVVLPRNRYYLTHHAGEWFREFQLRKTELTAGVKTLQCRDFLSFCNTPWFAVTDCAGDDRHNARVWFGQVHYSGNWRLDFDMTYSNHLQVVGGINFWDTSLSLKPGGKFITPKFSIGYTEGGTERAAQLTRSYVQQQIIPVRSREKIRPVIYNSWYATMFNVNEEGQLALAREAKKLGVELFVIDDGWFRGRKTDNAGLGDWEVDPEKFPAGLQSLIGKINAMGLDFGIWVEPEMVNPNSDLYRKHPDWVLHFPNRERTEWRNQLTLNLARDDVYNYLLSSMTNLLANHNIKFVKWDRNRGLTQPGWPGAPAGMQREVRIRYIENLYRLLDTLRERFPDVIFENCSSGAGRPDLGMLSRMDQTWTSDNTDPVDRLFIQYGYLSAYPANTMVCWTNNADYHRAGLSLDYTFDVAMQGVLGVGQNITKWTDAQKATATRKIAEYKQIRQWIQYGLVDRLRSPFEGNRVAVQYTGKDGAAIMCYNLGEAMQGSLPENRESDMLRLRSLKPDGTYRIGNNAFTGRYLMDVGIPWPAKGAYESTIVKIHLQ